MGILPLAETVPTVVLTGLLLFLTVLSSHSWNQSPRTGLGQIWQWTQIYFLFLLCCWCSLDVCCCFVFFWRVHFFFLFDFLFPFQATFCCEPRNVLHPLLLQIGRERESTSSVSVWMLCFPVSSLLLLSCFGSFLSASGFSYSNSGSSVQHSWAVQLSWVLQQTASCRFPLLLLLFLLCRFVFSRQKNLK